MTPSASTLSRRAIFLLSLALIALPTSVLGAAAALLTDLRGKATAISGGRTVELTILAELQPGTEVELAPSSTLVAIYLAAGEEYAFKGPATILFGATSPEVTRGAKPEKRGPALGASGKDVRIKPVGVAQGALVMRGRPPGQLRLLDLQRTRTLERHPEFRWEPLQSGVRYDFKLSDDGGRTVFETQIAGTSLKLPPTVRLKEAVPYTWELSARLPDGRKYSGSAEFTVASSELRAQAEALQPAASAPLSRRVAYAAWLEQMELRDEARKYWQVAAAERPEDPRLKSLGTQ